MAFRLLGPALDCLQYLDTFRIPFLLSALQHNGVIVLTNASCPDVAVSKHHSLPQAAGRGQFKHSPLHRLLSRPQAVDSL